MNLIFYLVWIKIETELRSKALEEYLCEAFGCRPCSVVVEKLSNADIAQIIHENQQRALNPVEENVKKQPVEKRMVKSVVKPAGKSVQQPMKENEYTPKDSPFLPPIPEPIQEIEVMDHAHDSK